MKRMGKHYNARLIQPGTLRKSISVKEAPRKSRTEPIEYWIYVRRATWYWKFIEFGTSSMAAQPFLRPAFDTLKTEAVEAIREYLASRIEKEKRNGW